VSGLSRRSFIGVSVGGLSALYTQGVGLAGTPADTGELIRRANIDYASSLNLDLFLQDTNTLGLAGLLAMAPARGERGNYDAGALFLFPFKYAKSDLEFPAFLPGSSAAKRLVAAAAMTPAGLPPDDYYCSYVLRATRENFIAFSIGAPFTGRAQKWPWHTNVDNIRGCSIGVGWTSSNFNHPWFAGSRWIPDSGSGKTWRARIIEGIRRVALIQASTFGGPVG